MKNEINLQDGFLNVVRQQGILVTIFLTNGFQMRGTEPICKKDRN